MQTPDVSVVVPAYNASRTIARALRSAAAQSGVSCEIIVIDDCSSDETSEIVRALQLPNCHLIGRATQGGASAARNAGIKAARGRFVAFLDADDEWLPGKLERQIAILDGDQSVVLVGCDCEIHWLDGRRSRHWTDQEATEGPEVWKHLLSANFLPTPTVVCRRELLARVGAFNEDLRYGEDLDLWIRIAQLGEVRLVREVLVLVHAQTTGLTRSQPRAELEYVLPLVKDRIAEAGDRLSDAERRRILGRRHFEIGYRAYRAGWAKDALPLLLESFRLGWRRGKSALFALDCSLGSPLLYLRRPG